MRRFLIFIAILGSAKALSPIPEEMKESAKMIRAACKAETGVAEEALLGMEVGKFPDDRKLACYLKCVNVHFGAVTGDHLDIVKLATDLPPSLEGLTKSLLACKETKGSDICDLSLKLYDCVYKTDPETIMILK